MRRFFWFFVIALCLALTGCTVGGGLPTTSSADLTFVAVALMTPEPTATAIPSEKAIIQIFNTALNKPAGELTRTLDAHFQALDIHFIGDANSQVTFLIEARCECVNDRNCCTLERTFVVIIDTMKDVSEKIRGFIPAGVIRMQVSCYDHTHPMGMIEANWHDLESYFTDTINGSQFGSRVMIAPVP